ncbi:hypothetical protein ES705_40318 [subsurface metagenome]
MKVSDDQKRKIAKLLAESLFEVLEKSIESKLAKVLLMTPPIEFSEKIEEFSFSGGIAEYIYQKTDIYFNDLGKYLGDEIRGIITKRKISLYKPQELIRATVIGAGQYTLQVSGVTTHISDIDLLPIHNVQVIEPKIKEKELTEENISRAIKKSLNLFDINEGDETVALLFKGAIGGSYASLTSFVKGVVSAIPKTIEKELPIILVFDRDIGNSVGNVMRRETEAEKNIISIDEITVNEGDFLDIDKPKAGGLVVPVVVKNLVFSN